MSATRDAIHREIGTKDRRESESRKALLRTTASMLDGIGDQLAECAREWPSLEIAIHRIEDGMIDVLDLAELHGYGGRR